MADQPRWKRFERLAERIASDLVGTHAEVTWDAHILGQQSGLSRQIDVAIRWSDDDGNAYLTVIDCKDWSRPADVNDLGTFAAVVSDVGATQGVLVCNSGFAETVHDYARSLGLQLLNLHDAESEHWARALTIPLVWTDLEPVVQFLMTARFEAGDQVDLMHARFRAVGDTTDFTLTGFFEEQWNSQRLPRDVGPTTYVQIGGPNGMELEITDVSGIAVWRPIAALGVEYVVRSKSWLGQFEPSRCRGYIDYLNGGAFYASYLPETELPSQRDDDWVPIDNVDVVAICPQGTLVTSEGYEVVTGSAELAQVKFAYRGP